MLILIVCLALPSSAELRNSTPAYDDACVIFVL